MLGIRQRDKQQQLRNTELTSNERMVASKRLRKVLEITTHQTRIFEDGFMKEIEKTKNLPQGTTDELAEMALNGDLKMGFFGNPLRLQYEAKEYLANSRVMKRTHELYEKIALYEPLNEQDLADLNRFIGKMRMKINWFRLFSI